MKEVFKICEQLNKISREILKETSTENFIEMIVILESGYHQIEVKSKLLVTVIKRKYIITASDFEMGRTHIYELMRVIHWSVWILVDPEAVKKRPFYVGVVQR